MKTIKFNLKPFKFSYSFIIIPYLLFSCSVSKQISKQAEDYLINDSTIRTGHIGISIYEPATGKYLYNYNADKYFIPASNAKLFTLYAGMKYLGDSLVGLRFKEKNDSVFIFPTADPTFLHPHFQIQPVFEFLQKQKNLVISKPPDLDAYGRGWAWEDHTESFMTARSSFPIYGNLVNIKWIKSDSLLILPEYFHSDIDRSTRFPHGFELIKQLGNNHLIFLEGNEKNKIVPFEADFSTIMSLLKDTLKNKNISSNSEINLSGISAIYSQPTDSLFKHMMHKSDNFFAEQTLLMTSNERLGYMSDQDIIDTLLLNDLMDVPQKPKWVDGSGLSRYNLFSPRSFIYILDKMIHEFGMDRIKKILPSGGQGSLKNYFFKDSFFISAKTGTISNNSALSGFLITKKGKLLIFSILANNYLSGAAPARKAFEQFLYGIREIY